jgi:hypothetical protein
MLLLLALVSPPLIAGVAVLLLVALAVAVKALLLTKMLHDPASSNVVASPAM